MHSVRDLILAQAERYGDREYLVAKDESFSFAELDRRSRKVAHGFSELGLKKGHRVAVLISNRPEFIFVWWALLRIGAVMVPINLKLTGGEIAYIINHAQARAAVLGELFGQSVDMLSAQCPTVDHWIRVAEDSPRPSIKAFTKTTDDAPDMEVPILEDDEALVLYTSGTTGFPKGVIHTHGDYLLTAESFARTVNLTPQDRLLTANPLFHVNAQFYSCMGTLLAGATFILAQKFSASQLWDWTRRYQANKLVLLLPLTTILYNRAPLPDDADNPVELVVAGGVPSGCLEDFQNRFDVRLQTLYSLTEAPLAVMSPPDIPSRPDAVGLPMITESHGPNEIRIVDERLETVPNGESGEIAIRNPALMKGYLNDPQATAEVLVDGWLRTGDRGIMDADGWIRFLGRAKDVIRRKGENISAAQVEQAIALHPAVAETAVVGVRPADAAGEEEVMAFIVTADEAGPDGAIPEWEALIAHCSEQLAEFKIPRFWKCLPKLPKNAMNRVVKKHLTEDGPLELSPGTYDRVRKTTC